MMAWQFGWWFCVLLFRSETTEVTGLSYSILKFRFIIFIER